VREIRQNNRSYSAALRQRNCAAIFYPKIVIARFMWATHFVLSTDKLGRPDPSPSSGPGDDRFWSVRAVFFSFA
jgi:hypothetical protein